jgi:integrase
MKDEKLKVTVYSRDFYIFKPKGKDAYYVKFTPPPDVRAALGIKCDVFVTTGCPQLGAAKQIAQGIISDHFPDPRDPMRVVPAVEKKRKAAEEVAFERLTVFMQRYEVGARTVRGKENLRGSTISHNFAQLKQVLERRWDDKGKELPRRLGAHEKMTIDQALDADLWNKFMDGWMRSVDKRDYDAVERAKVSINSTVACARSMFGDQYLGLYKGLRLPDVAAFRKAVPFLPEDPDYVKFVAIPRATIDAMESEIRSLRDTRPDLYLGYLLAVRCGMRRGEIANARLEWIEEWPGTRESVINIKPRSCAEYRFRPKYSARAVAIEPWVLKEVLALGGAKRPTDLLLPGTSKTGIFKALKNELSKLVRKHVGEDRSKTLHELRGQFLSEITAVHGIEEAQRQAGHRDMRTTKTRYVDYIRAPKTLASTPWIHALPDAEVDAVAATG